jgi:type II secretory pathway predicted ATPase ExeA
MYTGYFGLKEAPFTIAPNPAFLFMSDRHREALAHLTYGLGGSLESIGGFVLLTGEVGTGKTTICRSVMQQLPENTQAAFILNPTMSCEELLASICDNLKIRYKKTAASLKYLTDKIQDKLLKNHNDNINTLLVIDEAQHLKPEVLEQLRLLTNLETNTKKLLQVILIGQPELQQLLQRRDLRQLAQRITARYHLLPLTYAEVEQYIKHRLSVAQCTRQLFNRGAVRAIHQISQGIPRVINLLCDRALINAYGNNDAVVDKKTVKLAAIEALGDSGKIESPWSGFAMKAAYVVILISITLGGGFWLGNSDKFFSGEVENITEHKIEPVVDVPVMTAIIDKEEQLNTNQKSVNSNEKLLARLAALETKLAANELSDVSNIEKEKTAEVAVEAKPIIVGYQPENVAISGQDDKFVAKAEEGVSQDLLARFQSAVDEVDDKESDDTSQPAIATSELKPLSDMPQWVQDGIPALTFEVHIFASEGKGWVRVNGEDKYQGEHLSEDLVLTEILPQHVVLAYQGEEFTLPALSSW